MNRRRHDHDPFAAILGALPQALLVADAAGQVVFLNPTAEALTGCPQEEAAGRPLAGLLRLRDEQTHEDIGDPIAWALGYGAEEAPALLRGRAGDEVPVRVTAVPLPQGSSPGVVLLVRDARGDRRAEERLRLAEKMEAVGRLAGGVAHHFNNLLTIINGYSDLLCNAAEAAHPWRPMLQEIYQAGERAADLTRQLLALSRMEPAQPRVLDLNQLVSGLAPVLRGLLGPRVALLVEPGPDVPAVRADPRQLEQVVLQLAANARAAMPDGGTLSVHTDAVALTAAEARTRPGLRAGRHARLRVSDTGRGMSEAVRTRAFEPFFTTQEVGQGDGLGLATVYGIARQNGGLIEVTSTPGQGSAFALYLPAAETPPALTLPGLPRGTETVLLVEDEPMVCELNRQILHMGGYTVLEAADGLEALRVSGAHAGPLDLLVTDVQMPGMSGPELALVLTAQRPELRVLFLSGYVGAEGDGLTLGEAPAGAGFLAKPYAPLELARTVRALLDAADTPAGPVNP